MSSQKFFTLLYGDHVHTAPKGKVIPSDEISQLMNGLEVLQKVQDDAHKYRQEVVHECEMMKEQAQREGFEAGYAAWMAHIAELQAEIDTVHKAMEKTVIPVALKAARKILGREIELSETAIVDIVANNLKAVSQHKRITIWVNKDDLAKLEKNRDHLKKLFESLESLSIRPREGIASGGCVIETEAGIINAQIENQWEIIEHAFQSRIAQSQQAPS